MKQIEELKKHKKVIKEYLQTKFEEEDWHGVADAACDLRDIESELKVWKLVHVTTQWVVPPGHVLDEHECGAV